MYAIVETGGKQYKVQEGGMIHVEKLPGEPGDEVVLDKVLFLSESGETRVGTPYLQAKVACEVVEQDRGEKVVVFKHKKRKDYRKKAGHRQDYTALKIKSIQA